MAINRDHRFPIEFETAFPRGLVLVGEIGPDTEYQPDRTKPAHQRIDEVTGKRVWKGTVTDPDETKAKRASFEVFFTADVQPVPATSELIPGLGMRAIELEGLTVQPKVSGTGEFKYLAYTFRATGIRQAASGVKSPPVGKALGSDSAKAA